MIKLNKTEQIARFMLDNGQAMTANEVFYAGFRFDDGAETTANTISVLLNKMHMSNRYKVERNYITENNKRMVKVKVLSVIDSLYGLEPNKEINISTGNVWRSLLSSKRISV